MAEISFITGVTQFPSETGLRLFTHTADRITSEVISTPRQDWLTESGAPAWLVRHSFGEKLGEETVDGDARAPVVHTTDSAGRVRTLFYQSLSVPVSKRGYSHAVGPIHAGIIEPGHFRFSLRGETIQSLHIRLGFQHRGIGLKLKGLTPFQVFPIVETISADSSIAYALAVSQLFENAIGLEVSSETALWRCLLLEIERIAMHIGDLGALAGDVGYYPLQGVCSTDRGVPLGVMESLTGSRFGRAALWPGEVKLAKTHAKEELCGLARDLEKAVVRVEQQFLRASENSTLRERLQKCGTLHRKQVVSNGFIGMPARAAGVSIDLRLSEPVYRLTEKPLDLTLPGGQLRGDAWSRFYLRYLEIKRSAAWVVSVLQNIAPHVNSPDYKVRRPLAIKPGVFFGAAEGWRGSVLVALELDEKATVKSAYVRDPSVLNWHALELAVRDVLIGDFPLNNKSFNLSYVGFDL